MSPERIVDELFFDEVDASAEQGFQLLPHRFEAFAPRAEIGWRIGEGDQDVDIAVRTKLLGEHGVEERKLLDTPLPAEAGDGLVIDRDGRFEGAHVGVLFTVKPLRHL